MLYTSVYCILMHTSCTHQISYSCFSSRNFGELFANYLFNKTPSCLDFCPKMFSSIICIVMDHNRSSSFVRSCHRYGLKLRETRKRLGSEPNSLHPVGAPPNPDHSALLFRRMVCLIFSFFETALVSISTDVQGERLVYGDSRVTWIASFQILPQRAAWRIFSDWSGAFENSLWSSLIVCQIIRKLSCGQFFLGRPTLLWSTSSGAAELLRKLTILNFLIDHNDFLNFPVAHKIPP